MTRLLFRQHPPLQRRPLPPNVPGFGQRHRQRLAVIETGLDLDHSLRENHRSRAVAYRSIGTGGEQTRQEIAEGRLAR